MAKLLGANNQFLSERERQALLARLKREQLKARLEEKFGSAALVLGLAERQRKDAEERYLCRPRGCVFDVVLILSSRTKGPVTRCLGIFLATCNTILLLRDVNL